VKNILIAFRLAMAVIYTAIGIYLLVHPRAIDWVIGAEYAPYLGGFFIFFGVFRGYRAWFIDRVEK
jgi:hypothetical protein